MNILYLCTYYHRAMIFRDSMNYLEDRGNTVRAFNAVARGAKIDEKYKAIMDDKVFHRECFEPFDRYLYFRKQRKIFNSLIETVNVNDFDIIHSHTMMNGGWAARKLWKKYGIPYIVTARNTDLNDFLRIRAFRPIARMIIKDAAHIMFLSEPYREAVLNKCFGSNEESKAKIMKKSKVIRNGLESFWLENKGRPKTIGGNELKLICVGKIDTNKNMLTVLQVMDILERKGQSVSFTVIGQVVDENVLQKLQLDNRVKLIEYQKKEGLINYYRDSDIYIMPSLFESFGRVYAEAMTQGLPVIYTKGQGFDGSFVEGEVGYSVNPHNPEEIADAVMKIKENYSEISSNCIRNSDLFDWALIVEELDSMYHEAAGDK